MTRICYFIFILSLLSCNGNRNKIDTDKITITSVFQRFEKDLFQLKKPITVNEVIRMRSLYPEFFDLFCKKIIHIPSENDSMIAANLDLFTSDTDVTAIYRKTLSVFPKTDQLQDDLMELLKHFHYYFPSKPVPGIITYISAFNYTIITTDSAMGIGLDMYLGKDCEFYPALGLPKYMTDKLSAEYLLRDVAKALFQSDYDPDQVSTEFLSQIIYQGKLLYFTDLMLPDVEDTLKIGYSAIQLDWCRKNESNIWGFLIENDLLFSKDPARYIRYINDGNGTQGLPDEAPAKLGTWMGWQIVNTYMEKHPEFSIEKLLNETDAQKILSESGYKPNK